MVRVLVLYDLGREVVGRAAEGVRLVVELHRVLVAMRVVLDFYRGLAASSLACTYSTDLGQAEVGDADVASLESPIVRTYLMLTLLLYTYLGQAEVGDADVALVVEQHVLRLEVAVDHLRLGLGLGLGFSGLRSR
eukprot:scaffold1088_cov58-Phaeocystis_antarctica.AAC.3